MEKEKKVRPTNTNNRKKQFIEALKQSLGVISTACKEAGINRSTFYDWFEKDEDFKKEVLSVGEEALDFAESALYKKIKSGNVIAIIFYLKTKGKERGYVEKVQTEEIGGQKRQYEIKIVE